jgi:serine/threonine protein phosphatase 1
MKKFLSSLFGPSADAQKQFSKYLVVPDLHGTYSVYQRVERYIRENCEKDRAVIFLGDYMDRGESGEIDGRSFADAGSYYTIRDLMALKRWADEQGYTFIFLRGNHELFFENFFLEGSINAYNQYPFFKDSVKALEYVFRKDTQFAEDFIRFLKELQPYYLDTKNNYLFVHAGIDPECKDLQMQVRKGYVYWIRDKFILSKKRLPHTVIFGHTPFFEPFVKKDKIGLDSGIYRTGRINLMKIDGKRYDIFQL